MGAVEIAAKGVREPRMGSNRELDEEALSLWNGFIITVNLSQYRF
jgi:hypothetical protein